MLAWRDDRGRWPRRSTSQKGPEAELAKRWQRWEKSAKLQPQAQDLKARIDARTHTERTSKQADERAEGEEDKLLMLHREWCDNNRLFDQDHWREPALHRSRGGRHPYPGFSNLWNTCWFNAPLQCLLHCPAARAAL